MCSQHTPPFVTMLCFKALPDLVNMTSFLSFLGGVEGRRRVFLGRVCVYAQIVGCHFKFPKSKCIHVSYVLVHRQTKDLALHLADGSLYNLPQCPVNGAVSHTESCFNRKRVTTDRHSIFQAHHKSYLSYRPEHP